MERAVFRASPSAFAALRKALWPGAVWVALTTILLASPPVEAQQRDEALRELERTERILEQARELVSSTDNGLARQYLDQAMKLQNLARSALSVDRLGDAAVHAPQRVSDPPGQCRHPSRSCEALAQAGAVRASSRPDPHIRACR